MKTWHKDTNFILSKEIKWQNITKTKEISCQIKIKSKGKACPTTNYLHSSACLIEKKAVGIIYKMVRAHVSIRNLRGNTQKSIMEEAVCHFTINIFGQFWEILYLCADSIRK